MPEKKMYTVLGKAESYREDIGSRAGRPQEKRFFRSFEEARDVLIHQIGSIIDDTNKIPRNKRLDEVIYEVQLDFQFLAKSHHPARFFDHSNLKIRGTGSWEQSGKSSPKFQKAPPKKKPVPESVISRSVFVSSDLSAMENLLKYLNSGSVDQCIQEDVIKIQNIKLPKASDRLLLNMEDFTEPLVPVELVLFNWGRRERDESISRIRSILLENGVLEDHILIRDYQDGPVFIAARVSRKAMMELGELNFLRAARILPRVEIERSSGSSYMVAPEPHDPLLKPTYKIAVFDGGTNLALPHLAPYVVAKDLTDKSPYENGIWHGSAVCGAALFGSIDPTQSLEAPAFGILSHRVLPDKRHDDLALYGVIDGLEEEVPRLPRDVKVVNLSLGPPGPIDSAPCRFTYAIDRLSYEHDKLFFIAVGNTRNIPGYERIQAPSDSVNNMAVGAYTLDQKTRKAIPAFYSCEGPGRPGGQVKPDLMAFGGCSKVPFVVLASEPHGLEGTAGTSFSTPLAAAMAGEIFARVPGDLSTQGCRALMIHGSNSQDGPEWHRHGWGLLPDSVEELLKCTKNKVSTLYSGNISPRNNWRLPFLLPNGFDPGGMANLSWTIVIAPEIDSSAVDEYTLAGLEVNFRPHANIYSFTPPKGSSEKPKTLNIIDQEEEVDNLLALGWKKSSLPASDGSVKRHESILRAEDAKWDTVIRKQKRKYPDSIFEPSITISVVGRGEWDKHSPLLQARYAAVLTVDAPKYGGNLYIETQNAFPLLVPIELRSRAEILVRAKVET